MLPVYEADTNLAEASKQIPALPHPLMAFGYTATARPQIQAWDRGRGCACQLGWGLSAETWPPTVSEEGAQVSLAMTVKLKGHASECWGWLLCDLLGTSPYE